MVRQIQCFIPHGKADEIFAQLKENHDVFGLQRFHGEEAVMIVLKSTDKKVRHLLGQLSDLGVGVRFGFMDIVELQSTIPRLTSLTSGQKRKYVASDRMTVEEIHQFLDKRIHLTFDFIAFITVAAIIAGVGLVTNNGVIIVASMVLSPLISPIMGLTLGTLIGDRMMCWKSFRNEMVGVMMTFAIGMVIGFVMAPFNTTWDDWYNHEMAIRDTKWAILSGVVVAVPTGAGVAIAITGVASHSMVGVAISASLLPPIVNSGLNMSYGLLRIFYYARSGVQEDRDVAMKALSTSGFSGSIFLCNFLVIFMVALVVFRLKSIRAPKHVPQVSQHRGGSFQVLTGEEIASLPASLDVSPLPSPGPSSPRQMRPEQRRHFSRTSGAGGGGGDGGGSGGGSGSGSGGMSTLALPGNHMSVGSQRYGSVNSELVPVAEESRRGSGERAPLIV